MNNVREVPVPQATWEGSGDTKDNNNVVVTLPVSPNGTWRITYPERRQS